MSSETYKVTIHRKTSANTSSQEGLPVSPAVGRLIWTLVSSHDAWPHEVRVIENFNAWLIAAIQMRGWWCSVTERRVLSDLGPTVDSCEVACA